MTVSTIYNSEAEMNVLASIIKDNNSICKIIDILKPEDFYNTRHMLMFKAMTGMYENREMIDLTTLCEKLGARLPEIGGVAYVSQVYTSCLSAQNILSYGEIVKEKSNKRKIIELFKSSMADINEKDIESCILIDKMQDKLIAIKHTRTLEDGSMEGPVAKFLDRLEERWRNGGDIQGVKCGFGSLDKVLGGFMPQDFIILAARPSMGKTAVALNLALNLSLKTKVRAAFFNLEMGKEQIIERAVSCLTDIPMHNLKNGNLNEQQWVSAAEISCSIASSELKIFDKIFTLRGIKEECKRLKLQGGLDVVFIDYLQLISSEERSENRTQDISRISRSLKLMAKELDITVVSLSQLSRAPEARADHRPMLSDLRESGAIEQDADIVMFLYRDEYYNPGTDRPDTIECIVAKNRNGEVGTVRFKWSGECQRVW